ncbi:Uncharacterised protein [Mycobacteroides abscessus subsp. abscessus]|nr:Uncharacterised protein [Mycobacteroides abscessus subsp. abscessus]
MPDGGERGQAQCLCQCEVRIRKHMERQPEPPDDLRLVVGILARQSPNLLCAGRSQFIEMIAKAARLGGAAARPRYGVPALSGSPRSRTVHPPVVIKVRSGRGRSCRWSAAPSSTGTGRPKGSSV